MRCKSLFVLRVDHYFNWRTKFTAPSRQQETMLWLTLASRPCVSRASLCFKCFKGLLPNYNRHNWGLTVWLCLKRLKQPFDQAKVKCKIWSSKSIVLIKTKHISGLVSLPCDSNWISWIWDWMLEVLVLDILKTAPLSHLTSCSLQECDPVPAIRSHVFVRWLHTLHILGDSCTLSLWDRFQSQTFLSVCHPLATAISALLYSWCSNVA